MIARIFRVYFQKMWRFSERRSVKKIALGASLLVVFVVGGPFAVTALGQLSYKSNDFGTAQKLWRLGSRVSWYDRDVPFANAGIAYYQAQQLSPAIDQLEQALKIVAPKRNCQVRWNLALVSADRADRLSQSNPNDAVGDYARAINVLDDQSCLNNPQFADKFKSLSDMLKQKLAALVKQISDANTRPAEQGDEKNKTDTTTSDEDKAKDEQKRQNDYQHDINTNRYNQQTDDEKNKSYSTQAW